jgi:hypothetical protein
MYSQFATKENIAEASQGSLILPEPTETLPWRARHHREHSRGDHRVQERALFKTKIGG